MAGATLVWQEWRIDGTSGPKLSGTAIEFGNAVQRTSPPSGDLDEAVDALDEGTRRAGSRLYSSPGTLGRVSKIFGTEPSDEAANMAALVIINAMVFQERLASNEVAFQPVSAAMRDGRFSRLALLQVWEHILSIDYYPMFSMARDVVQEASEVEVTDVLGECATTAATLLGMGAVGRHDLAGRIFNRLISEEEAAGCILHEHPRIHAPCGTCIVPGQIVARRLGIVAKNCPGCVWLILLVERGRCSWLRTGRLSRTTRLQLPAILMTSYSIRLWSKRSLPGRT